MLTLALMGKVFGGAALIFLGYLVGVGIGVARVERIKSTSLKSIANVERLTETTKDATNVSRLLRMLLAAETSYANKLEQLLKELECASNEAEIDEVLERRYALVESRIPIRQVTECIDRRDWAELEKIMHGLVMKVAQ